MLREVTWKMKRSFNLIELIAVLAVFAIIISLVFPSALDLLASTSLSSVRSLQTEIQAATDMYVFETGGQFPRYSCAKRVHSWGDRFFATASQVFKQGPSTKPLLFCRFPREGLGIPHWRPFRYSHRRELSSLGFCPWSAVLSCLRSEGGSCRLSGVSSLSYRRQC